VRWSSRSLQPILTQTGLVALLGVALGLSIYGSLRVLPLRALRRTLHWQREESKAREEAEEHLRVVFQNAVEGIAILTPNHLITSCNPAMATCSATPSSRAGHAHHRPAAARSRPEVLPPFFRAKETIAFRAGGSPFPVEMSVNEAPGRPPHI
jgi:PAS domain-containing protein